MVIVSQLYAEKAWQRIWSALDKDGDGVISEAEIARLDRDGDGTLDRHELMSALKQAVFVLSCSLVLLFAPRALAVALFVSSVRRTTAAHVRTVEGAGEGGGGLKRRAGERTGGAFSKQ